MASACACILADNEHSITIVTFEILAGKLPARAIISSHACKLHIREIAVNQNGVILGENLDHVSWKALGYRNDQKPLYELGKLTNTIRFNFG